MLAGWLAGRLAGWLSDYSAILQVGTCQILRLAETPRWSRVWQQSSSLLIHHFVKFLIPILNVAKLSQLQLNWAELALMSN